MHIAKTVLTSPPKLGLGEQDKATAGRPEEACSVIRPTKTTTINDLRCEIAAAFEPVKRRISYFDTIQTLMGCGIWEDLYRQLRLESGKVIPQKSQCLRYPFLVRIQQPSPKAIQILIDARDNILVNRVDVAFDFETSRIQQAWDLHSFFRLHLTQLWHGKPGSVVEVQDSTTYYRRAGKPRNIVIYDDMSKLLAKPSLHLEIRMVGHASCRKYGVGSLRDLLRFDDDQALVLLTRNCRFSALNPISVQRGIERFVSDQMRVTGRKGRSMTRPDAERLAKNFMAALLQTSDGRPDMKRPWKASAQNWIDHFPEIAKRSIVHVDWDYALANKGIEHAFCVSSH